MINILFLHAGAEMYGADKDELTYTVIRSA